MGCCLGTNNSKLSTSIPKKNQHSLVSVEKSRSDAKENRAPPPSVEEETVKEVLSETPKPTPPSLPLKVETFIEPEEEEEKLKYEEIKRTEKPVFERDDQVEEEKTEKKVPIVNTAEEISEGSEICSLSESLSAITNITRDEDDEVRQRVVNRSPMKFPKRINFSGDIGGKRERVAGRSPNRRTDQSPVRRNGVSGMGSVRMVQSREPVPPKVRRALRTEPNGRDAGKSSARSSRSPATRSNVGQSTSVRRSGKSPGRAAKAPVDSTRRTVEEPSREDKWPNNSTNNESLENPLVSLECFIFL